MPDELIVSVHQRVHDLLVRGLVPSVLQVGWRQYGVLLRHVASEPDGPRLSAFMDMQVELIDAEDHLEILALDRRM